MTDAAPPTVAEFLALHLRPSGPIWVLYDPPEPAPDDPTDSPATGDAV